MRVTSLTARVAVGLSLFALQCPIFLYLSSQFPHPSVKWEVGNEAATGKEEFSQGASSAMKGVYANNLSNLTDPRTVCRTGVPQASQAAGKLPQLPAGPRLGSAGLLSPLHHHRHSVGFNNLGAAFPVPPLSRERELSAGLCPALSAGEHPDYRCWV